MTTMYDDIISQSQVTTGLRHMGTQIPNGASIKRVSKYLFFATIKILNPNIQ